MKKLITSLILLNLLFGVSLAGNLSLSPDSWSLGKDCVVWFDIVLDSQWESIMWADLLIDSSMEYVDFVPGQLFQNTLPPVIQEWNLIRIGLFSYIEKAINTWWILWTIYFKDNTSNYDSYINFVIKWDKSTVDTSLFVEWWIDVLDSVSWWSYIIDWESCIHNGSMEEVIEGWFAWITYEESIEKLKDNLKKDQNKKDLNKFFSSLWFKLWVIWLLIFIVLFFIIKRRWSKKEK